MKGCDIVAAAALIGALLAAPSAAQNNGRVVRYDNTGAPANDDAQGVQQQAPSTTSGDNDRGTTQRAPSSRPTAQRSATGTARTQGVELIIGGSSKDGAAKKTKLPIQ